MIINRVSSVNGIVLVVHITLVTPNLRIAEIRWNEHNNLSKSSEPSKHLQSNINHCFTWAVISSYISLWWHDLNEQNDFERFYLEMVSHRAINDIIQTLERSSLVLLLSLNALDN